MRKKINLISAFIGVIFMYGFSLLPHWILYGISDFAFILVYRIFGYRKKVVYENLKIQIEINYLIFLLNN